MVDENIAFLKEAFLFWDKLVETEQQMLIRNTVQVSYKQGENIHSADNECIGVLIVISGEIRTYILSEEGKEITLYRLNNGDVCILSASCLIKNITFDVHIDAERDSEVLLVNSAIFSKLLDKNIYVENFSLKVAIDKFSDVMWAMEQILFMSFDRRLAVFLLDELAETNSDTINLTHEQIAKYMGSAREVVSRMVKYFVNEGMIESYRGYVKILDKSRLIKLAQNA